MVFVGWFVVLNASLMIFDIFVIFVSSTLQFAQLSNPQVMVERRSLPTSAAVPISPWSSFTLQLRATVSPPLNPTLSLFSNIANAAAKRLRGHESAKVNGYWIGAKLIFEFLNLKLNTYFQNDKKGNGRVETSRVGTTCLHDRYLLAAAQNWQSGQKESKIKKLTRMISLAS